MKMPLLLIATAAAAAAAASAAAAQAPAEAARAAADPAVDASSGDIIVTAQRREQRLNDVPISISAFSKAFLDDHQITRATDLITYTPGLAGYSYGVSNPRIAVRGIIGSDFGIGGDSTIGVYVDDVFIGRMTASVTQLFDVERIEVLKGPQGALVGRNSTAGVISIITRKPGDDYAADLLLRGGNLGERQADIGLDLPFSDTAALRLAGRFRHRGGYVTNVVDGERFDRTTSYSGRGVLVLKPAEDLRVTLVGEVNRARGRPPLYKSSYQSLGGLLGVSPEVASATFSPDTDLSPFSAAASDLPVRGTPFRWRDDQNVWQVYGRVEYDVGDAKLTSITSYRDYRMRFGSDDDGTPLRLLHTFQNEDGKAFSQELRLTGTRGLLDYIAGVNYLHEKVSVLGQVQYDETLYLVGTRSDATERAFASTRNDGWGIFADLTAHLTDKLSLTGGLRYSIDRKHFGQFIPNDPVRGFNLVLAPVVDPGIVTTDKWHSLQPRANLQYRWSPALMTYVSVAKGYRSGGFNSFGFQPAFDPETVWNYEAGLKGSFWNGRGDVQLSVFHYDYDDLQVLVPSTGGFIVQNAATAHGDGGEFQLTLRPARGLSLSTGLSVLDAKYGHFVSGGVDRSGNRLARAPKFTATSSIGWSPRLSDRLNGTVLLTHSYISRVWFTPAQDDFATQGGYHQFDAKAGVETPDRKWGLSLFVNNIGDKRFLASAGGLFGDTWVAAQPRTYGIELTAGF